MTATKHIQGTLSISKPERMNAGIRDAILRAAVNNGLGLIIKEIRLDGSIEINSYSPAFGGRESATQFIESFTRIFNEKGIDELEMSGSLMLTVTSNVEPVAFRLTLERGVLAVEEAALTWERNSTAF